MAGPINGVRVIDMTTVLMGPFATQILGDLGADVIKVESPEGDSPRFIGPSRSKGMGGIVLNLHRNKRSIVLDLKKPSGKEALLRLARKADVIVHNIRPQAIARLGLAYGDLKVMNPSIIYCGAQGYRRDGPYGYKAAYDDLIQGASGVAALVGRVTGEPGYVPTVICDKITGLTLVYAVLAGLLHRERTGEGQEIEVPMFETMVSFNLVEHIAGHAFEPPLGKSGYARLLTRFRKPFRTLDAYACILPYSDQNWSDFFEIAGRPELAKDPRFTDLATRTEHIEELYALVEEIVAKRATAEWMELCDNVSIPAMPVIDLEDMWQDPHLKATDFFRVAEHPTEGSYWAVGMPVRFSGTSTTIKRHAPRLGQHSVELLLEVGYSRAEIDAMIADGATVDGLSKDKAVG